MHKRRLCKEGGIFIFCTPPLPSSTIGYVYPELMGKHCLNSPLTYKNELTNEEKKRYKVGKTYILNIIKMLLLFVIIQNAFIIGNDKNTFIIGDIQNAFIIVDNQDDFDYSKFL